MYIPKHFEERELEVLHEVVRTYPFGLLVSTGADGAEATSIPFLLDASQGEFGTLQAHVARANPVWRAAQGKPVLVVFQGPHGYVTPSWYPSKATDERVVPTWNYVMVQARGQVTIREDRPWLRAHVTALTTRHEQLREQPWSVSDAPADYVDKLLGAIVGLEIPIQKLQGKLKLSQNRSTADQEGVARGLASQADCLATELTTWMRARKP